MFFKRCRLIINIMIKGKYNEIVWSNTVDIFETAPIIIHMLNDLYNGVDNGKIDNNLYWDVNNNIDNLEETLICIEDKKIYIILDEHILILWFIGINYVKK